MSNCTSAPLYKSYVFYNVYEIEIPFKYKLSARPKAIENELKMFIHCVFHTSCASLFIKNQLQLWNVLLLLEGVRKVGLLGTHYFLI